MHPDAGAGVTVDMNLRTVLVGVVAIAGCQRAPVVEFVNTYKPGTARIEGTVAFPAELPVGTRVQVAMTNMPEPVLGAANAMKSIDLKAATRKVEFVFSDLGEGTVAMYAIAYRPEVLANLRRQVADADAEFKKTGKPTMLTPMGPDVGDQAGFYSGQQTATIDPAKAKGLELKAGSNLKEITFTTLTLEKKP